MKIKVTEKEILSGARADCSSCPVALALRRYNENLLFDGEDVWSVDEILLCKLEAEIFYLVFRFDLLGRGAIRPFEFRVSAEVFMD